MFYLVNVFFAGPVYFESDYFKGLLADHFNEGRQVNPATRPISESANLIQVHGVSPEVFARVVTHVYCNQQALDETNVYEIMSAADMLLLPELKRSCGLFLGSLLDPENVVPVLETAGSSSWENCRGHARNTWQKTFLRYVLYSDGFYKQQYITTLYLMLFSWWVGKSSTIWSDRMLRL